jgi:hypothetical protein
VYNLMAFWFVALATAVFSAFNERNLRRRGFDVDGVDSSADMLDQCHARAAGEGLDVVVHHQKMETLDLPRRYRSIFLAGPTFNLLPDDDTALMALRGIRAHLEPGGTAREGPMGGRRTPPLPNFSSFPQISADSPGHASILPKCAAPQRRPHFSGSVSSYRCVRRSFFPRYIPKTKKSGTTLEKNKTILKKKYGGYEVPVFLQYLPDDFKR